MVIQWFLQLLEIAPHTYPHSVGYERQGFQPDVDDMLAIDRQYDFSGSIEEPVDDEFTQFAERIIGEMQVTPDNCWAVYRHLIATILS